MGEQLNYLSIKKPIKESEMDYNKKTYDDYIITGSVYRFVKN